MREKATSVFLETGRQVSRVGLLRECLRQLERRYETVLTSGFGPVLKRWRELTHVINQHVTVDLIDRQYTGRVQDIDGEGALILKDGEGNLRRIFSGDLIMMKGV